jgi:hypothetical protein
LYGHELYICLQYSNDDSMRRMIPSLITTAIGYDVNR